MIKNGKFPLKGTWELGNSNTHKYKTWKDEEEKKNGRAKIPALFISAGASPLLGRGGFLPVLMVSLSGHDSLSSGLATIAFATIEICQLLPCSSALCG